MPSENVYAGVSFLTNIALEQFFIGPVDFERGLRFLLTVNRLMCSKGACLGKGFLTNVTRKRPFPNVESLVCLKVACSAEGFATNVTRKRSLSGVDPLMRSEIGTTGERFATDLTIKWGGVDFLMRFETTFGAE